MAEAASEITIGEAGEGTEAPPSTRLSPPVARHPVTSGGYLGPPQETQGWIRGRQSSSQTTSGTIGGAPTNQTPSRVQDDPRGRFAFSGHAGLRRRGFCE